MEENKKNPRSWSAPYWKDNHVADTLKEAIEPDEVDVSSIQYHEEKSPLIWDENGVMKEDVRKILLLNAKRFIEFSDLESLDYKDVILTGSMANYNFNENSDLDVHIILDFDQISENEDFVSDFLRMKKTLWNEKMPIQVKGHDVEMYYQDASEPHHSTGTYSILKNEWINEPTKQIVDINSSNIQLKSADLMNSIDDLVDMKDRGVFLEKYNRLKDKIKKMRQSGLENEGEFSSENLAFKVLRNTGYLGKLVDLKTDYLTQELSMNEKQNQSL